MGDRRPDEILVVGAGAVGGYFGGRLAQAGRDVTFPGSPKASERNPCQWLADHQPPRLNLITASDLQSAYDIVFLSVKSYGLAAAMNDFAAAVGPQTVIFPRRNGMRHMDVLERRFGKEALLGVCLVAAQLDAVGRIIELVDFQESDVRRTRRKANPTP